MKGLLACLLLGRHEMFTSQCVAPPQPLGGAPLPPHVFEREGYIVSAPPCSRCGKPNPDAFGWRYGVYWHRIV